MRKFSSFLLLLIFLTVLAGPVVTILLGSSSPLLNILRGVILAAGFGVFLYALVWAARCWGATLWIVIGLLVMLGLCIPARVVWTLFTDKSPELFTSAVGLSLFMIASIALIVIALLLYSGLKHIKALHAVSENGEVDQKAQQDLAVQSASVFTLATLLLALTIWRVYWLTVWDNTTDPLGYIWLILPVYAAVFAGVLLAFLLTGKMKLLSLLYSLLVLGLLITISARAQQVDFRQLTQARAERVKIAIESYYSRFGKYPDELSQLGFWSALNLPGPSIIFGQDWCYDGGDVFYRLGYVDREHWSDPRLIGRIYKSAGELPALQPMCIREIAALQARDPTYPYSYWKESQ